MSDNTLTADQQAMQDIPEFAEALASQASGEYEHTLFELWDKALESTIKGFHEDLSMEWADSMLRGWPYLSMEDLPGFRDVHVARLEGVRDLIISLYPKPAKHLYRENVDDWGKHKDAYIDVIVEVTKLTNEWVQEWLALSFDNPLKRLDMVSITIANAMLMGQGNFINQVEYLSGFEITDEEGEAIDARIRGEEVTDE